MDAVSKNKNDAYASILIVEDDFGIREVLSDVLRDEGYGVVAAENGLDALEKLGGMQRPCLILLDLMMPVMSGFDFIEYLEREKNDGRGDASIPIVVVTAYPEQVSRLVRKVDVVKKPIRLESLLHEVERHCKTKLRTT